MFKLSFILLFILGAFIAIPTKAQTYNYYFGNIHAHSSYSDGNQDSATSLMTKPLQDFNYAKASQHIDFYGISEHNHYSAGMTNPANFHRGIADANTANADGSFVALYGMEWGVISGGGHVIVYGYDSLMGWDSNDYDVYVAEDDYSALFQKINEKPGSFAYLAHPQASDYGNLFTTASSVLADNAIIGMAARSGPAASTNSSYSNPSSGNYIARYNDALKRGYHLGVGLDHDTHNSVFGRQTAGRLVVLAPALTRADVLDALRNMRFYSSDDWNLKVNFTIAGQPMGSSMTRTGTPVISVSASDADGENVSNISIYYGVPGSGSNATLLTSATNTAALSYTHALANNATCYYYARVTQADGNIAWTSPIWYTRNDGLTNTPPLTAFTVPSVSVCAGEPLTFMDNTTNGPDSWSWTLPGALPTTSANQNVSATYYTAGTYTVSLTTSNAFGAGAVITKTITVSPAPVVVLGSVTICEGATAVLTASGASTYTWSTGASGASITLTPTVSALYTVTGFSNGCFAKTNAFVIVKTCTSVGEQLRESVRIYPNPANHFLSLDFSSLSGQKAIELYDNTGKQVLTHIGTEPLLNLDLAPLANGIYMLKVTMENSVYFTEKIVVER